jgi:hypothetical protein
MIRDCKNMLVFAGMLICLAGSALAGGGHHNITSTTDCYPVDGEAAKTRNTHPEYVSKPYARCLAKKRKKAALTEQQASEVDAEDGKTDNNMVVPRKYFRIIKDEDAAE